MLARFIRTSARRNVNVSLIGAAGGIGQPLALLLKGDARIKKLNLFDLANPGGVAADLSHISTTSEVTGFTGADLGKSLAGADIVIVPAGVPRKPGMTRDDLFDKNASVVLNVGEEIAKACPKALILIITNPVNSTVPIMAEVLKKRGVYDPRRVFGVTTLDLVRTRGFVARGKGEDFDVPVIGGHSGPTIVPLLSAVKAGYTTEELEALTHRIQYAGDEVVKAKDAAGFAGSATLSMAFAGYRFADKLITARGGKATQDYAFVESNVVPGVEFFSTLLTFDANGVKDIGAVPKLTPFEDAAMAKCVEQLKADITKGQTWARSKLQ